MAELGAFFGNPNLQRQGARARALAAQRDVNTLADPRTYAIVQGLLGTAPDEMGFSVLNPDYEKIRKVAEPAFALGLLGQASPFLAPMTKGLPVGASVKNVGNDLLSYRGSHKAPNAKTYGATLDDLTKILPEDVYTQQGKQLYGIGDRLIDSEWRIAALKARGKPDAEIEVFRAVPKGVKTINDGDWVSTSKKYAKDHGENTLNGEYDIISKKVKAKTLSTEGYPYEYGYNEIPTAPRQEALDTAQRNAALPIEEGGLGLPKDNTPEMRAQAMGFDLKNPQYHATNVPEDFTSIRPSSRGKMGAGIYTSPEAQYAEKYGGKEDVRILPMVSRGNYADSDTRANIFDMAREELYLKNPNFTSQELHNVASKEMQKSGYSGFDVDKERLTFRPDEIRSRFAAFDPFRRDTETALQRGVAPPDLLAGVLPLGLLADEEQRKKLYELMPSLLGE